MRLGLIIAAATVYLACWVRDFSDAEHGEYAVL